MDLPPPPTILRVHVKNWYYKKEISLLIKIFWISLARKINLTWDYIIWKSKHNYSKHAWKNKEQVNKESTNLIIKKIYKINNNDRINCCLCLDGFLQYSCSSDVPVCDNITSYYIRLRHTLQDFFLWVRWPIFQHYGLYVRLGLKLWYNYLLWLVELHQGFLWLVS